MDDWVRWSNYRMKKTHFSPSFLVNYYGGYAWKKPLKLTRSSDFYGVSIIHSEAIKSGTVLDTYIANNILSGYSKCKQINLARQLFEEITQRDIVSWNSMITGYVNLGKNDKSWELFKSMKRDGFNSDQFTFGSILKGIAQVIDLKAGKLVHSMIIKIGYESNVFTASALLDMYSKCKRIQDAYLVFECIPERNFVSWNALITGYAQIGDRETAFFLFDRMERDGIGPDDVTFSSLLTLLDDPKFYKVTAQIHAKTIKCDRLIDTAARNATITSYSECGSLEDSRKVFDDEDDIRDSVTWNSMLAAYVVHDCRSFAVELFIEMQRHGIEQDMYTYSSVLSACFGLKHQREGKSLHALAIKRGLDRAIPVCNSLIAMYMKSSSTSMEDAIKIFDSMELKDNVSWNSILTGVSQNGLSEDALKFFGLMRSRSLSVDEFAFSSVIRSCSDLATLQLGQQIHVLVLKSGFESDDFVSSSLIFMYSKCGVVEDARKSFNATPRCSTITWNSIIFGYAQHGQGKIALDLFLEMNENNVKLDHITFVAVLTACSHIGLVDKGLSYLNSMESNYGIRPRMEHFACGVDLLGRAGYVSEAKKLIEYMPFEADATVLKTLLGACRLHGDIELATEIAKQLLILEPDEHCTYVLLSSMYGHLGSWEEKASIKRLMKKRMVKKVPGWSWIEVKNEVHSFNAEDRSHPQHEEVYQRVEELMEEIRWLYHYEDNEFSYT